MGSPGKADKLVKSARIGNVVLVVAQVPLAKNTCLVAGFLKEFWKHSYIVVNDPSIGFNDFAILARLRSTGATPHAIVDAVGTRHNAGSSWGTEWVHAKLGKSDSVCRNSIHYRCSQVGLWPVVTGISVTLVVREYENDIRL